MWRNVVTPALVVILFWVVSSLATTYYVRWLDQTQTMLIAEDLSTIQSAGAMRYTLRHLQDAVLSAAHSGTPEAREEVDRLDREFQRHLTEARATSTTPQEHELVRVVAANYDTYRAQVHAWLDNLSATQPATTARIQTMMRLADTVAEPCKQLTDVNERFIRDSAEYTRRVTASMTVLRVALLVIGLTLGILCGLWVERRFHRSLASISVTLHDVASNLDQPVARIRIEPSAGLTQLQEQAQQVATRVRAMVDELHRARKDADAAARLAAVGELAAGVAHELRNPLTSVKLLVQTAAQRHPGGPLPPKQLEVLQQEIARMESTIERLVHFARPPKMNRVVHDLRETIQRAVNLVAGRADQAGVRITTDLPSERVCVCADPDQMHQAMVNLLINGIEAMVGGGKLHVCLRPGMGVPPAECRVTVQDNGPGIPPDLIDRVFEPFVTGKERGTGLGLAISRRIVLDHGGSLIAANGLEGGAVFTLVLPLAGANALPLPSASSSAGLPAAAGVARCPSC